MNRTSENGEAQRRVLLLLHELTLSGAPKVILDAFKELGGQISLRSVSLRGGPRRKFCREMGPLQVVDDLLKLRTPVLKRVVAKAWSASLRRWKPDVIYINSAAALPILDWLDLPDVPVILHVHELDAVLHMFARPYQEKIRNWPHRYITVSEPVSQALVTSFGVDPAKITLIHEFVTDEDYQAAPKPAPPHERFVIGGAGRPDWRKGPLLWLQTAAELRKILGPDAFRFVWVGVPEDPPGADNIGFQFRQIACQLDVNALVQFVPVTREPLRHFAEFDVFAMTSWEDPCPIVVLENMMLGKPVLCFAGGGGAPEEVAETGIVVEGFSPRALAEKIAELAADPARTRALGEAARRRVGVRFVASIQAPKILKEIDRVIARSA